MPGKSTVTFASSQDALYNRKTKNAFGHAYLPNSPAYKSSGHLHKSTGEPCFNFNNNKQKPSPTKSGVPTPMTKPVLLPPEKDDFVPPNSQRKSSPTIDRRSLFHQPLFAPPTLSATSNSRKGVVAKPTLNLRNGEKSSLNRGDSVRNPVFTFSGPSSIKTSTPNDPRVRSRTQFNFPASKFDTLGMQDSFISVVTSSQERSQR